MKFTTIVSVLATLCFVALVQCSQGKKKAKKTYELGYLKVADVQASPKLKKSGEIYYKGVKVTGKNFNALLEFNCQNVKMESTMIMHTEITNRMYYYVVDLVKIAKSGSKKFNVEVTGRLEKGEPIVAPVNHGSLVIVSNTVLPINEMLTNVVFRVMHNNEYMISVAGLAYEITKMLGNSPYYYAHSVLVYHPLSMIYATGKAKNDFSFLDRCMVRLAYPYFTPEQIKKGFSNYNGVPSFVKPEVKENIPVVIPIIQQYHTTIEKTYVTLKQECKHSQKDNQPKITNEENLVAPANSPQKTQAQANSNALAVTTKDRTCYAISEAEPLAAVPTEAKDDDDCASKQTGCCYGIAAFFRENGVTIQVVIIIALSAFAICGGIVLAIRHK